MLLTIAFIHSFIHLFNSHSHTGYECKMKQQQQQQMIKIAGDKWDY